MMGGCGLLLVRLGVCPYVAGDTARSDASAVFGDLLVYGCLWH